MGGIVHITNGLLDGNIVDGGSSRENALAGFLQSQDASRLGVQDTSVWKKKHLRPLRPFQLLNDICRLDPELVILNYPAYPFFWRFKVDGYMWGSILFSHLLRHASKRHGFRSHGG